VGEISNNIIWVSVPAHAEVSIYARVAMTHYLFQAQYRGVTLTDDIGEDFSTLREAEAYATVVANELGRNDARDRAVTVSVLSEDGELLARSAAIGH
jgi:uncharacterized protein DUF6894